MTLEERMRLSYYRDVSVLDEEHAVIVVQHTETKALYLKKVLDNYQLDIFTQLKSNPVPNMPRIFEAIEDNDKLIVIESYITGETLQQKLDKEGVFTPNKARSIGIQLCNILGRLHAMNIIHRDIKPGNIIFADDGTIKLLDLDAAKVYKADESQDTQLMGTREYAAPEQYGFGASSPATDVYAIGILLNVLVTGTYPRILMTADPDLSVIIQKCIRMEPTERYSSILELRDALAGTDSNYHNNTPIYSNKEVSSSVSDTPVPAYAPTPFAYGESVAENKKGWRRFLLPGFRTGKIWKILTALLYYFSLGSIAYKGLTDEYEVSSAAEVAIAVGCMLIVGLGLPIFICNFLNIWRRFHIDRKKTPFLQYCVASLWFLVVAALIIGVFRLTLDLLRSGGIV